MLRRVEFVGRGSRNSRDALLYASVGESANPKKALRIYFVDVEGGQATLFVTPEKQSLLIDTGWPGNDGRDAERIVAATKAGGDQED